MAGKAFFNTPEKMVFLNLQLEQCIKWQGNNQHHCSGNKAFDGRSRKNGLYFLPNKDNWLRAESDQS